MLLKNLELKPFQVFDDDWALMTAGSFTNHNSMTIAWGGLGTLWHRNVATIYVKPIRYTYKFLNENEYFVISFFTNKYKKALGVMGSKSGKDINKDELAGLTPKSYKGVTIYEEAKLTLICKKIYYSDLDITRIPSEEVNRYYKIEKPHRMFIGEVIEAL